MYEETTPVKLAKVASFNFAHTITQIKKFGINKIDAMIRYGMSSYSFLDLQIPQIINDADSVKKASNKFKSSIILRRHSLPVPKLFLSKTDITKEDLPVLKRNFFHSRGTDIVKINDLKDMVRGDYYVQFVEGNDEYRFHVFDGKVIRVQKKVRMEGKDRPWLHNVENGFNLLDTFTHNIPLEKEIISLSERAVTTLGLDFGAVDVLISKENRPYILEVNTAPRLNKFGRELYTLHFYNKLKIVYDINMFPRLRLNQAEMNNGLPLRYREIVKNTPKEAPKKKDTPIKKKK